MPFSLDEILPSPKDGIKGDIFIRCPTTGQPVPTGLHTGTVVFDTLPKIEMRTHCPACQKDLGLHQGLGHRKRSAKLEPSAVLRTSLASQLCRRPMVRNGVTSSPQTLRTTVAPAIPARRLATRASFITTRPLLRRGSARGHECHNPGPGCRRHVTLSRIVTIVPRSDSCTAATVLLDLCHNSYSRQGCDLGHHHEARRDASLDLPPSLWAFPP
jgi:hypothetical protein